MECVSTTSFSISINGSLKGFFKGKKGIRQGDPMSPYLFVLMMEVFSGIMKKIIREDKLNLHPKCSPLHLSHLAFADDLLLFSRADHRSAQGLKEALLLFQQLSGLSASQNKSQIFFGGCGKNMKKDIIEIIGFPEGALPIRYLGLLLITNKLKHKHCKPLIDKIKMKIGQWHNKSLSFAGRAQLIKSVIGGLINFWTIAFPLPNETVKEIRRLLGQFLWGTTEDHRAMHKVSWDDCYLTLDEGGLGFTSVDLASKVPAFKNVWQLLSGTVNIWTLWAKQCLLKHCSFWQVKQKENDSWYWKSLLELRGEFQRHLRIVIGNGSSTSIWFDWWLEEGPLF